MRNSAVFLDEAGLQAKAPIHHLDAMSQALELSHKPEQR